MRQRLSRLFGASILLAICFLGWSMWSSSNQNVLAFYGKGEPTNSSILETSAQLRLESIPKKNRKDQNHESPPDMVAECLSFVMKKTGLDKCDLKCFSTKVSMKDSSLKAFIEEGWGTALSKFPKSPKSHIGKFYQAVYLSGVELIYQYRGSDESNLPQSIKLFEELMRDDPNNLYLAMYFALALKRTGQDERAKVILEKAVSHGEYRSYTSDIYLRLTKATAWDPGLYMMATGQWSTIPMPSMKPLEELQELDETSFIELAKIIGQQGVKHQGKYRELKWNILEHEFARSFLRRMDPTAESKIPDYKELTADAVDDLVDPFEDFDRDCDLDLIKEKFKNFDAEVKRL